ncbi:MAG: WecB/TagA/CpsF family glycosyltransferase [Candidatus Margulisbacteria bacterium]|jgi:N-acetylglucosaminyldiphosphoundecaprenol N-acetyl-beta-D-mannosaminyltransferase|nr:WecB/TagA/CpsF family glycosyltransferase [Candidatus Margulisiibacteriota bacterium]
MAEVLGTRVDIMTRREVEQKISAYLKVKSEKSCFIVTANAEICYRAAKDPELRAVLNSADLCLPDSVGARWALRRQGIAAELYPGVELAEWILRQGFSVYVLGAKPEVLARLRFPNIVGKHHGFFDADAEKSILAEIQRLQPQVILAALGAGKQELWLSRHKNSLKSLLIGVGGAIDVISGCKRRAPKIFRKAGLEWFYRLLREPQRLFRQLNLLRFCLAVLREKQGD